MEYLLFPVKNGVVTTGFWELRPYSKPVSQRTYIHRAWDIAHEKKIAWIVAPENGMLRFHIIFRNPVDITKDLVWDDTHKFYLFSRWYYDTMGAVSVLEGSDTGYLYAFAHQDVNTMFHLLEYFKTLHKINWKEWRPKYNQYIRYYISVPVKVGKGDVIGRIGCAGYATGYHTHMQIHKDRDYTKRIDPATLFPDIEIHDNGSGPKYGACKTAPLIPSMDMLYCK